MEKAESNAMKVPILSTPSPCKGKGEPLADRSSAMAASSVSTATGPSSCSTPATDSSAIVSPDVTPKTKKAHYVETAITPLCTPASPDITPKNLHKEFRQSGQAAPPTTDPEAAQVPGLLAHTEEILPEAPGRTYYEFFFVNMPMFSGYAALFGLQHEIKSRFGINDDDKGMSEYFGFAVSFLYIFNLIFRFSHNIVFGFLGPRGRTLIAMMAMVLSMLTLAVPICIMESYNMGWVILAYCLGGIAIGTFESNFLASLTPLGHQTKHVAITAIPVGITATLVGGFFAMGPPFHLPPTAIYIAVAFAVTGGVLIFVTRLPRSPRARQQAQMGLRRFVQDAKEWRAWLPQIWHIPLATAIDMFSLSAFSPGVALYIWDAKTVALAPWLNMPTHDFFALFNTFNMLGGLTGRILSYRMRPRHPLVYTVLNIAGAALLLLKIPSLALVSTFIVMMGDGLIYGSISKRIDTIVPAEFNLIALSFWLFVGDFGSVAGSNLISYIRIWVVGR